MANCYRRDGTPCDISELEFVIGSRRVASTNLPNGLRVSTVFLGINHQYEPGGPPLIFETMVFPEEARLRELDMKRYSTEEQAVEGHVAMCNKWIQQPEEERHG